MTVDHRALERTGAHALLQFRRRLVRRHGRQRGKTAKALRTFFHRFGDGVVGVARERVRVAGIQLLGARRSQGQHLKVDAGGVHRGNAFVADVAQGLDQFHGAAFKFQRRFFEVLTGAVEKHGGGKMFFKCNDTHGSSHPSYAGIAVRRTASLRSPMPRIHADAPHGKAPLNFQADCQHRLPGQARQ